MMPSFIHICVSGVKRRELLMILKMVYYPELSVCISQELFPNMEMEGNELKKSDEIEATSLTPLGGNELHYPGVSHLYSF
ncbi:unnamed protein product [Nyctereutes procyonoides]|uniref:Neuronal regeneration-related protein n=1 Tax=Nyctereutes procyonoides TaxID=34880 RepID=A0A811ZWF3_NYCPR|nr:unnamed protein product [Nyctereutes procyonoides]